MTQTPVDGPWPAALPAVQFRIARPTDQLEAVLEFYHGVLGLPVSRGGPGEEFEVAMVGLPGAGHHIEFVTRRGETYGGAPNSAHMLVFYFATADEMNTVRDRIVAAGRPPVEFDNEWWTDNGAVAYADPDGYPVALMPAPVALRGLQPGGDDSA